jgi:hypothetical protein
LFLILGRLKRICIIWVISKDFFSCFPQEM